MGVTIDAAGREAVDGSRRVGRRGDGGANLMQMGLIGALTFATTVEGVTHNTGFHLHVGVVEYMAVLGTAVDRACDERRAVVVLGIGIVVACSRGVDIDNHMGVGDISQMRHLVTVAGFTA